MPLVSTPRFIARLIWFNLRGAMAYRAGFLAAVGFMALNDAMWIVFWSIFFSKFPVLRSWSLDDVVTLWAVAATGFGIATALFGNARADGIRVIISGRLDYYLALPRNVLLHFIAGNTSVSAYGDVLFGLGAFALIVQPDAPRIALFVLLALCAAVVFVAAGVLIVSTAFWAGNTEGLGIQLHGALMNFSTYPLDLFNAAVKVALFTVIPAAFTTYLPVTIIRDFDPVRLLVMVGFTAGFASLAVAVFYTGLRRYESGSLVATQG